MPDPKQSGSRKLEISATEACESRIQSANRWLRGPDYAFRLDAVDGFTWSDGTLTVCFCGSYTLAVSDPNREGILYLKNLIAPSVAHEIL